LQSSARLQETPEKVRGRGGEGGQNKSEKQRAIVCICETDPMLKGRDGVGREGGLVVRCVIDGGKKMEGGGWRVREKG